MVDLSTEYMGLHLRNPLIVSSCSLTKNLQGVTRCADAGAGAIVLKSLFEEQIKAETKDLEQYLWLPGHPEAFDYISRTSMLLGPREYLKLVEEAKNEVSVPIIASLNCISSEWWVDYAAQIEAAGADALELNISLMPSDLNRESAEIERMYLKIFRAVKPHIDIPIAVKLGPYFTSMAQMANEFYDQGVAALVLFNRFYQLDIDIEKLVLAPGYKLSSPQEISLPLRWVALLSGRVGCDLAPSTGVHDGAGVIKLLLAGASAVQICSTLYLNGLEQIGRMLGEVEDWMKKHDFDSISAIRGKLSQTQSDRPELYERLQYIKTLVGIE